MVAYLQDGINAPDARGATMHPSQLNGIAPVVSATEAIKLEQSNNIVALTVGGVKSATTFSIPDLDPELGALIDGVTRQYYVNKLNPPSEAESPVEIGTDADNADFFVAEQGVNTKWCEPLHIWLVWDGKRWKKDNSLEIERLAERTARGLLAAAAGLPKAEAKRLADAGARLLSQSKMDAMVDATKRKVTVDPEALDNDRGYITCANGVIELASGKLLPFTRERLATKMTDIVYDPNAQCPKWEAFLKMIMADNDEDIRWLQRAVGYTLTGYGDAKMFTFLYGGGDNGKSTFLETLNILFSEYAQKSSFEALTAGTHGHEQKNTPFTARLKGARFVYTDEVPEGAKLNSSLMKDLAGGDQLTAMAKYSDPIAFMPTHFFWIYGNHKPVIQDDSDALWGRIKLVKFGVTIPAEMRRPMGKVLDEFRSEMPGILTWAVNGAIVAIRDGVGITEDIKKETSEYREGEDNVGLWFKDECEQHPNYRVDKKVAYAHFTNWAEASGMQEIPSAKTLTRRLGGFGVDIDASKRNYAGMRLL
jgi:putative DNA primase/helicase